VYKRQLCALALVTLGTALFAVAPDLGSAAWQAVLLARVLIGAGLAATGASVQMALAQSMPAGDYGYASGLLVTLGGVGGLLGTWPLAIALERFPWSLVFGAATGLAALVMVLVSVLVPNTNPAAVQGHEVNISFIALLRNQKLRGVLCLGAVTYAPIVTLTGLWGGPYLQDVHGLKPEVAGQALMGLFATTIIAGFIFGRVDRIGQGRSTVIVFTGTGSALCLVTLALLPAPPAWAALLLMGGSVFLQQFYIPLGVQLRDAVPAQAFGRANALFLLIATGAIPVMQTAFGLILDLALAMSTSSESAYRMAFGSMAAVIAVALVGYRHAYQSSDAEI